MDKALPNPSAIEYDPARDPLLQKAWTAWRAGLGESVTQALFGHLGTLVDSTVFCTRDGALTLEVRTLRLGSRYVIDWLIAKRKVALLCRDALADSGGSGSGDGNAIDVRVRQVRIARAVVTDDEDDFDDDEGEEKEEGKREDERGQLTLEKMEHGPKFHQLVNAWDEGFGDRLGELLGMFPSLKVDARDGMVIGVVRGRLVLEVRSNRTRAEYPHLWERVEREMRRICRPVLGHFVLVHNWPE